MKATLFDTLALVNAAGTGTGGPVASPIVMTWQTSTMAANIQSLTFMKGGEVYLVITFQTVAEAALLGSALGGAGGVQSAVLGP